MLKVISKWPCALYFGELVRERALYLILSFILSKKGAMRIGI